MERLNKILSIVILVVSLALLVFGFWMAYLNKDKITQKFQEVFNKNFTEIVKNATVSSNPGTLFGPKGSTRAATLDPVKVISITNDYRRQNGLTDLTLNSLLTTAANTKSKDMIDNQYFEHISPSGVTPSQLVTVSGYQFRSTGENLAMGDFTNEKELVDAWMASPGHRANILNKDYTEIGVDASLGNFEARETWFSVQEFGRPAPDCILPNKDLLAQINTLKTQYETLAKQRDQAYTDSQTLAQQANEKIKEGNRIYKETSSTSEAQPYWDDGGKLRGESNTKFNEVKTIETQLNTLFTEINDKTKQYNALVNTYNTCIKE